MEESQKPVVFISHASTDGVFANAVKHEIEKVFADGVVVFSTSSSGAIGAGSDWLAEIESRLERAQAVITIVTPVSIERPWLWFEGGWGRSPGRRHARAADPTRRRSSASPASADAGLSCPISSLLHRVLVT